MRTCRSLFEASAPRAAVLIRFAVGVVFASEGIQKFLYADARGAGRFAKIGIPAPEMVVGAACWAVGMGAQDSIFKAASRSWSRRRSAAARTASSSRSSGSRGESGARR